MTPIAVYSSSLFKARNSTCDDKLFDALSKVKKKKKNPNRNFHWGKRLVFGYRKPMTPRYTKFILISIAYRMYDI